MPRIHNFPRVTYKNQTVIATQAREAKRTIKAPYSSPELRLQGSGMRPLRPELKLQEGSVKLSTLAAISLPSLGALLGISIQSYVNKSNLIQVQDADTFSIWHYLARPETTLDYVSVISAGLIGGLVGYAAYRAPAFFRGNGGE